VTSAGVVTATAVSPATAAANGGFVNIGIGEAGKLSLAVPAAVLMQALNGSREGLPMVTVCVMAEDLAAKLKAAGQAAGNEAVGARPGPAMVTEPLSIKLYGPDGKELKHVQLVEPMTLKLEVPPEDLKIAKCAYWEEETSVWSNKGLQHQRDQGGLTDTLACSTNHLTIFAAVIGVFQQMLSDIAQALLCSNAQSLLSIEGLMALGRGGGWWQWPPAMMLWIWVLICAIALSATAILDLRESQKLPWEHRLLVTRASLAQTSMSLATESKASKRSSASVGQVAAPQSSAGMPQEAQLFWRTTGQNSRDLAWQEASEASGAGFSISGAIFKMMNDAPNAVVTKCVRMVHARKASIDEDCLRLVLAMGQVKDLPGMPRGILPQPESVRSTITNIAEQRGIRDRGKEAVNTFLETSFLKRVAILMPSVHPLVALAAFSLNISRTARLALLVLKISASGAAAAVFFQASGGALGYDVDEACEARDSWVTQLVQAVTVGLSCAFIGDFGVVLLGCLTKDSLWQGQWQRARVKAFWSLWTSLFSASIVFLAIFLANVSKESGWEWASSSTMSLLEEMVIMPMLISVALAMAASLVLLCLPRIAARVRETWETDAWARDDDADPAKELAAQLDDVSDDEGEPSVNARPPEDAAAYLRAMHHKGGEDVMGKVSADAAKHVAGTEREPSLMKNSYVKQLQSRQHRAAERQLVLEVIDNGDLIMEDFDDCVEADWISPRMRKKKDSRASAEKIDSVPGMPQVFD